MRRLSRFAGGALALAMAGSAVAAEQAAVLQVVDLPAALTVAVGDVVEVQLLAPDGTRREFSGRGGPPGLVIHADGRLSYVAQPGDLGRWELTVRLGGFALDPVDSSLVIDVVARGGDPWTGARAEPRKRRPSRQVVEDDDLSFYALEWCAVSVGFAAGLSDARDSWEQPDSDLYASASPAASLLCGGGEFGVGWFAGLDTAPTYAYLSAGDWPLRHRVGVLGGVEGGRPWLRLGLFGAMGLDLVGLGGRLVWMPGQTKGGARHGVIVHGMRYLDSAPAGVLMVTYGLEIGRFGT